MLKPYLWLTLWLHLTIRMRVTYAADEREHVHIKVHMPEVVRKHIHQHKVVKHHHHPQQHKTASYLAQQHRPLELDIYAALSGFGGLGTPAALPHFPGLGTIMPEPDLAPNYGPALFDNEIYTANEQLSQQLRLPTPPVPPPSAALKTLLPTMSRQLMQQLFAPELMSLLAGGGAAGGAGGHEVVAGDGAQANKMSADDFFVELQREMAKKYAQQRLKPQRLAQPSSNYNNNSKPHKRKKYGSTGIGESYGTATQQLLQYYPAPNQSYRHKYQQQQQHTQQQPQQPYNNNNNMHASNFDSSAENDEDDFDEFMPIVGVGGGAANTVYNDYNNNNQQQQQQQPIVDDFDGASSSNEDLMSALNGVSAPVSYQDMLGAYATPTAAALTASQPTIPTRLKWRQYHQQQQQQQPLPPASEQLPQQQHAQQLKLPAAMHITPARIPISGITAATLAANDYGQAYKHFRQKRLKNKQRNRLSIH